VALLTLTRILNGFGQSVYSDQALDEVSYETPSPIQAQTIPLVTGRQRCTGPRTNRHR